MQHFETKNSILKMVQACLAITREISGWPLAGAGDPALALVRSTTVEKLFPPMLYIKLPQGNTEMSNVQTIKTMLICMDKI